MPKFIDITGKRYGRLTVICRAKDHIQPNGSHVVMWKCLCDCGEDITTSGISLRRGKTKSCGCLHKDCAKKQGRNNKKYNKYDLSGEYGIGWTANTNQPFYFDLEDYDKIKNYCWYENDDGYIKTNETGSRKTIAMHRMVLDIDNDYQVDHIRHNVNDNRKSQLRVVTGTQNNMNRRKQSNNTSSITGVYWDKAKQRWCAEIMINRKNIYIGVYKNFNDAVIARKKAEEKYFGEYSYDNSMR